MRRIILLLAIFTLAWLCGCTDGGEPIPEAGNPSSPAALTQVQVLVDSETGGTAGTGHGHQLVFPANVLTQDTTVTLTVLTDPPFQPRDPDFEAVGPYLHVDLGPAAAAGNVEIAIPYPADDAPNAYIQIDVGDQTYLPLPTTYDAGLGVLKATFNPTELAGAVPARVSGRFDLGSFVAGAGDSDDYKDRPDHVNWPSWNAYRLQDGAFVPVIRQGQLLQSLTNLGTRPLIILHGLGSNIRDNRFVPIANFLVENGSFTSVLAFEYDTLNSAATSGMMLRQFYQLLNQAAPDAQWWHLAHSMGCVVSRQGFEQGGSLPYKGNNAVFVAGPHSGTPIVNAILAQPKLFDPGMQLLIQNDYMDFSNADGTPCKPRITDQGFNDLAENSTFITALNGQVNHPKETYRTLAGTQSGTLGLLSFLLGLKKTPEDGIVPLQSANPTFIGAVESGTVPDDHVEILDDAKNGQPKILLFFKNSFP